MSRGGGKLFSRKNREGGGKEKRKKRRKLSEGGNAQREKNIEERSDLYRQRLQKLISKDPSFAAVAVPIKRVQERKKKTESNQQRFSFVVVVVDPHENEQRLSPLCFLQEQRKSELA